MPSYPFLSDEWLDEARKIRAEYEGKTAPVPHVVRMNLVVTAVPFSDEDILAHMDTSSGELVLDTGSTTWSCTLVKTRTGQVTDSSPSSTAAAPANSERAARSGSPSYAASAAPSMAMSDPMPGATSSPPSTMACTNPIVSSSGGERSGLTRASPAISG